MEKFLSVSQMAEKWNISKRRVQLLCAQGRIQGVQKVGYSWIIPAGAKKPLDARFVRKEKVPMSDLEKWQNSLETYLKQAEPEKKKRVDNWQVAIGLQEVDGKKPSKYLLDLAEDHIAGNISIGEVTSKLNTYYKILENRSRAAEGTEEADKVSGRIAEILGEQTFKFSPAFFLEIHRRLFQDILEEAGKLRRYNIVKPEWVLGGATVTYASWESLKSTLDYDFSVEKEFSYEGISGTDAIKHLGSFIAGVWQIHPFVEGNTRTVAVFFIKYLNTLGLAVNNTLFKENSWYFRNALVRANFADLTQGIYETKEYLLQFMENLLLSAGHKLKNRYMHIDFKADGLEQEKNGEAGEREVRETFQSAKREIPKCRICTLEEIALLKAIGEKPEATQKELAKVINKSERTVKSLTTNLQEKGVLERRNGKRHGFWVVKEQGKN